MKRGALNRDPKVRALPVKDTGEVYAGGPGSFDESKGRYTAPPRGSERLSPGVYRAPGGQLITGQGRPLPRPQPMAMPVQPQTRSSQLIQAIPANQQPMMRPAMQTIAGNLAQQQTYNQYQNAARQQMPEPVNMQKPWMNMQQNTMPQLPRLSMGQVANMSGDQIQQYIDQLQQLRNQQNSQVNPQVAPQVTQG